MKFWTTGRIDILISFEMFQPVMLEVEKQINSIIANENYGQEIIRYDVIINIFDEIIEERFKYSPKNRNTDIDVVIDHDSFLNADYAGRCDLYLKAVLHSIDGIKGNKHLKKFEFDRFAQDISSLTGKFSKIGQ